MNISKFMTYVESKRAHLKRKVKQSKRAHLKASFLNKKVVMVVSNKVKDFMAKVCLKLQDKNLTKIGYLTLRLKVVVLVDLLSLSVPRVGETVEANVWFVQVLSLDVVM